MGTPRVTPPTPPIPQRTVEKQPIGPRPVGGVSGDLKLIQSLDGFVDSVTAAAYEIKDAVKQLHAMNERTQRYYGSSVGDTASSATAGVGGFNAPVLSQMMGNVMSQTFSAMGFNIAGPQLQELLSQRQHGPLQYTAPTAPPGVAPEQHDANRARQQAGQSRARAASPDQAPPHQVPEGVADPTLGGEHYGSYERYRQARESAPHSLAELRQRAIGYAQKQIQQRMPAAGRKALGRAITEGGGDLVPTPIMPQAEEAAASSLGQTGALGRMSTTLGALGEEGGAGALASILPEAAAGPAGWAVAGATLGFEGIKRGAAFVANQRAENARFQAIMGGSNIAGFGQRAQQSAFRYGQLGVMGGEQANQLFMGITETGLRGKERQRGLDFAVSEYKRLGMTVEESLNVINVAVQRGKTNFADLGQSLEGVSDAAAKAGVNTEKARKVFLDTYTSLTGAFGAQGAQASTAAGFSTQNRLTQNINVGGTFANRSVLMMAAANSGISVQNLQALGRSPNPTDQSRFAGVISKQFQVGAQVALGPEGKQAVLDAVRSAGGKQGQRLSPEQYNLVIMTVLRDPRTQGTIAGIPGGAQQILQQMTGQSAPDDNSAWIQIIDVLNGGYSPQKQVKQQQQAAHQAALGSRGLFSGGGVLGPAGMLSTGSLLSHVPGGGGIQRGLTDAVSLLTGKTIEQAEAKIPIVGGALSTITRWTNPYSWLRSPASHIPVVGGLFGGGPSGKQKAQAAYADLARRHPDVLQGPKGEEEGASLDWLVTQHGGEKVNIDGHEMSVQEAIKRYGTHFNMLKTAKVGKTGLTLGQALASGLPTGDGKDGKDGKGGDSSSVKGQVTISAKPELQRWLNFVGSGAASPSPSSGIVPMPNQTMPGFGQSGTP
jgi:hypothetical protein